MPEEPDENSDPALTPPHPNEGPDAGYPSISDGSSPYREYPSLTNGQPYPNYSYPLPPNGQPYTNYSYPPLPNGHAYPGYSYPPPSYVYYSYPPLPNGHAYPGYSYRQPLSLGEAIKQLPKQYLKVLMRPGVATFAQEKQKAAWNIIWVQIAFIAIIGALGSFVSYTFVLPGFFSLFNIPNIGEARIVDVYKGMALEGSLSALISTPMSAFLSWTIFYFIARAFKGRGEYVEYIYSCMLFYVPLQIISGLLLLIPFLGFFLNFAISIYSYILMIFMTMAVHRLGGGKASIAVLILPISALILSIIAFVLLFIVFNSIISGVYSQ